MLKLFDRAVRAALLAAFLAVAIAAAGWAQTLHQFDTTPWNGYAPGEVQCGTLLGANANITTDQPIYITVPSVYGGNGAGYYVSAIIMSNASVSLTTASGGVYGAASKAAPTLAANQALSTLTAAAQNAAGSAMALTLATGATTDALTANPLYFSLTTGQGAAATVDVRVYCRPLYGSAAAPY